MNTPREPQPIGALLPGALIAMVGAEARLVALINRVATPAPPTRRSPRIDVGWNTWLAEYHGGSR